MWPSLSTKANSYEQIEAAPRAGGGDAKSGGKGSAGWEKGQTVGRAELVEQRDSPEGHRRRLCPDVREREERKKATDGGGHGGRAKCGGDGASGAT